MLPLWMAVLMPSASMGQRKVTYGYDTADINAARLKDYGLKIKPNPTRGAFLVSVTGIQAGTTGKVTVCNAAGVAVYAGDMDTQGRHIDLSVRPAGVYIVETVFDNRRRTARLIKE